VTGADVAGPDAALVGVLGAPSVGATTVPAAGVMTVPAAGVMTVHTTIACGVLGVPPLATTVCATEVCLANSSIIAIGFSTEAIGETNKLSGSKVGVAAGAADNDCVQAEIIKVDIIRIKTASKPRCLLLIDSPLSIYSNAMVAHEL